MVLFINPANSAPGVHMSPAPGASWEKHKKNLLRNHMAQSFHMLCGPMYNTLLYKCCQWCPWGPYRPRPRHVIIYHRLITEIYEKIFSAIAWHKACIFDIQHCHVELYINPANLAPGVKYGPTPGVIIGPWPCEMIFLSEPKWQKRGYTIQTRALLLM